jgi:NADH-quinone oxidoreductase subunit J
VITGLFLGFAALLVACSLMVILHKNPVTSALFLVLAFCSLAGIYLLLHAEFVAMVQIIVYAGAIMVLFLFVIMYLNLRRDIEHGVHITLRRIVGWSIGIVLAIEAWVLLARRWAAGPGSIEALPGPVGNTQAIGQALYTRYLFPFEITSMLLLVAMVGAVVIARGRVPHARRREPAPIAASAPSSAPAAPVPADLPPAVAAGGSGSTPNAATGGHA